MTPLPLHATLAPTPVATASVAAAAAVSAIAAAVAPVSSWQLTPMFAELAAVASFLSAIMAVVTRRHVQKLNIEINSRMTELVRLTQEKATAEGRLLGVEEERGRVGAAAAAVAEHEATKESGREEERHRPK